MNKSVLHPHPSSRPMSATASSTTRVAPPRAHRPRTALRPRASMPRARAAPDDDMPDVDFIGTILQDVRKGQKGFATRMRVDRDAADDDDDAFPVAVTSCAYDSASRPGKGRCCKTPLTPSR